MQNLESDNILDWLLQVSGQAGRVGWQLYNSNDKTWWGALPFSITPPHSYNHTYLSHLVSHDVI